MSSSRPGLPRLCGVVFFFLLLVALAAPGRAGAAPTAPSPSTPADGASVTIPFTISWSQASDPSGILAYNWQVSSSSTFAKIVRQNSVTAPATQDTVSGLGSGTYFWRVQAVSNDFVQGRGRRCAASGWPGRGQGCRPRPRSTSRAEAIASILGSYSG